MSNELIINDVIHGQIRLSGILKQIVETKEFKRLKYITQTGTSRLEFPKLEENNRYDHSIGAYHIMEKIIEHIEKELKTKTQVYRINEEDRKIALISMLLHDIGHGPYSHTFEKISEYSHEQRTIDILKDKNSEINQLLTAKFGEKFIDRTLEFIMDTYSKNDMTNKKRDKINILKALKSLISNQVDADRLDYLLRDSFYTGFKSAIDIDRIIEALKLTIENDEIKFVIMEKDTHLFEQVLLERSRNYHYVYLVKSSVLGDIMLSSAIKLVKDLKLLPKNTKTHIKKFFNNPKSIENKDFIELSEDVISSTLLNIAGTTDVEKVKYICNVEDVIRDFRSINKTKSIEEIKRIIKESFPKLDLENTDILIDEQRAIIPYKANEKEGIRVVKETGEICDLRECYNLINTTPTAVHIRVINPELIRLELGLTIEEYNEKYKEKVESIIEYCNKSTIEFELKYIPETNITIDEIVQELEKNGFRVRNRKRFINEDEYYDNTSLDFATKGESLRVRTITQTNEENGKKNHKYKITYKKPTSETQVFASRDENEIAAKNAVLANWKEFLKEQKIDTQNLLYKPILTNYNNREVIAVNKNGVNIDVSYDRVKYINNITKRTAMENMIEIEPIVSDISDRLILVEINEILSSSFKELEKSRTQKNKYVRGLELTGGI